jgi:hypothetical protein
VGFGTALASERLVLKQVFRKNGTGPLECGGWTPLWMAAGPTIQRKKRKKRLASWSKNLCGPV